MAQSVGLRRVVFVTAFVLAGVSIAAPKVTEKPLASVPPSARQHLPAISPDSSHIAFIARTDNKMTVVRDGVEGATYDWIVPGSMAFSPDSKRLAFVAQSGGDMWAVIDGQNGPKYARMPLAGVTFSPDSQRIAYPAQKKDGKWVLVVDGQESKPYARVGPIPGGAAYSEPLPPRFSADSKRVGLHAEVEVGRFVYLIDAQESEVFAGIVPLHPTFSPDSRRVAMGGRRKAAGGASAGAETKMTLFVDGKESGAWDEIAIGTPVFSPDSKRWACAVREGKETLMVVDGATVEKSESLSLPVFSPDSKRLAFRAVRDGKSHLIVDGKSMGAFDAMGPIQFSPDSQRIACRTVRDKNHSIWADGKEQGVYAAVDDVGLAFSPDSRRLTYRARKAPPASQPTVRVAPIPEQIVVVLDGRELGDFDTVATPPAFSPDSAHIAWVGKEKDRTAIYVDGQPVASFESLIVGARIVFDGPKSLHTIGRRGDEILRIQVDVD